MGIINRLEQHVAELIAAGEVVERPASVVKELVENALDAGATAVTVEIQNGGMTFLRVTDNGSGMYREDVPLAFVSHATSKIRGESDLEAISTMGFRGEALASVAAVAHVELLTRREDELEGTRYCISGGREEAHEPAGCPKGTTILVRDLFYNTPARLKFVKKDVSEANAVAGALEKLAVSHPEVTFQFIRDGERKLSTPGDGKLLSAVYAVHGRDFAKGLCAVQYESGGLTLEGLLSRPEAARPNRSMQSFFINGRYVKSRTCSVALEEACKGAVMVGRFPACVLNLMIAPDTVDVNVHPAKIEVRFSNEKAVFDLVYFGVKNALSALLAPEIITKPKQQAPAFVQKEDAPEQLRILAEENRAAAKPAPEQLRIPAEEYRKLAGLPPRAEAAPSERLAVPSPAIPVWRPQSSPQPIASLRDDNHAFGGYATSRETAVPKEISVTSETTLQQKIQENTASVAVCAPEKPGRYASARLVGELFSTYILLENEGELVFIDKHAAHERVLFESLKEKQGDEWRQALLAPVTVTLAHPEYSAALEFSEALAACGFEAEDFGGGSVLVRTAPMWVAAGDIPAIVSELCAALADNRRDVTPEVLESLYHSVACRAAVKGGNKSTGLELAELVRLLSEDESIKHCPHGRPVAVTMTRHELEKQFGRV